MPRKKPTKLDVFADTPAKSPTPPAKTRSSTKRHRPAADADDSASNAQLLKRQALEHKSINSTEGSLLRSRLQLKEEENSDGEDDKKPLRARAGRKKKPLVAEVKLEPEPEPEPTAEELFSRALEKLLPPDNMLPFLEILSGKAESGAQEIADLITEQGCWTPDLVALFGTTDITNLDLSVPSTTEPIFLETPDSALLDSLFTQGHFNSLTTVSLRNLSLSDDDLSLLRLLPNLASLDLCNTNIGTHGLHHLVCHRHNLTHLNIALNSRITDDTRIILRALTSLQSLFLRGTSFTLPALRRLVLEDLPKKCRLLSLPAAVIEHLNSRGEKYALDIPAGMVTEPDAERIAGMNMPFLKRNLELHQKCNKDIQVTGTKVELVARLRSVLWNRKADERILAVLGRGDAA